LLTSAEKVPWNLYLTKQLKVDANLKDNDGGLLESIPLGFNNTLRTTNCQ